jgi:hypothetical protein
MPHKMIFIDVTGHAQDFIKAFIEDEYETFPVSTHDDMLDCISRIVDEELMAVFPNVKDLVPHGTNIDTEIKYNPLDRKKRKPVEEYMPKVQTSTWKELMTKK